jgi:hypothetical protein
MTQDFKEYGLGRIQSPFDKRDYNLANFIPMTTPVTIKKDVCWDFPSESLNQGENPFCVGYSIAGFGIASPVNTMYTNEDGDRFYFMCKEIDGNPGGMEGSYIRTGAKVLQKEGRINSYAFAPDIATIKWWVFNKGSVVVGTLWTQEMFVPDKNNIISINGDVIGGHAYLIRGIRDNKYFRFKNSWGDEWRDMGDSYIKIEDFERLFRYGGEAMAAVELPHNQEKPVTTNKCWFLDFIKNIFK